MDGGSGPITRPAFIKATQVKIIIFTVFLSVEPASVSCKIFLDLLEPGLEKIRNVTNLRSVIRTC